MEWMGTERVRGYLLVKVKPARNNFNPGMDKAPFTQGCDLRATFVRP